MTAIVRTLSGDVAPSELGWVNYHEHLFQASPLLRGEELDDAELSGREAELMHADGIDTMIDATPLGLGRDVRAAAAISARTGLRIVHATGAHHGGHYPDDHPLRGLDEDGLAALFLHEVAVGFGPDLDAPRSTAPAPEDSDAPQRAGIIKTGIRYWSIGDFERRVLFAACRVQRATGVPIMVHTEYGSATVEVLELLAEAGARLEHVILAHLDRNPDPGLHRELASTGAYLGYDGPARHQYGSDQAIIDCAAAVAETHLDRLLLGGDVARRSRYIAYGGMPGLHYLTRRFLPRLRARLGEDAVEAIMRRNPARVLAFEPDHSRR